MPARDFSLTGIFASFSLFFVTVLALIASIGGSAQTPNFDTDDNQPKQVAEGYVTAVNPPNGFAVNSNIQVTTTSATTYKWFSSKDVNGTPAPSDALQIGAFVRVTGTKKKKAVTANLVEVRNLEDETIKGFALIDKVNEAGPEPIFAADGYRIRETAATQVRYPEDVKSQADVYPGMWLLYEGKLGEDGLLIASKARFLEHRHAKEKSVAAPNNSSQPATRPEPPVIVIQIVNGKKTIKLDPTDKYSTDDIYTLSDDKALQARVLRVGMSLVPVYQRQLPADDPAKIHFHFYAIDDLGLNDPGLEDHTSTEGLILIPAKLAARYKSDDQLAAVLADSIGNVLQQQAPIVFQMNRDTLKQGAELAAVTFLAGGIVAGSVYQHEIDKTQREQRGRVALELMADAGYDPWQAPEAWRLAAPGKWPTDISKLKYPERSGYQLSILNLMYRKSGGAAAPSQ